MVASKRVQLALIAVGAALLTGAIVMFGLPPREVAAPSAPSVAERPAASAEAVMAKATESGPTEPQSSVPPAEAQGAATLLDNAQQPAFDIVRVGPAGDSVIAGRAAPGNTLELLVDGKVHDSIEVRETGAFALTPPALPPGDHELTLREVSKEGAVVMSRQSVTVALSGDRTTPPVVALAEPDKPTTLLSSAGVVVRELDDAARADTDTPAILSENDTAQSAPVQDATPSEKVAIATVEAEAGRLYVSGQAPPDSAVRLYLNDSFLAQGTASDKGVLSFRIDSGIAMGDYRVRLDEVTPADGKVRSRAEVGFSMREAELRDPPARQDAATGTDTAESGALAKQDSSHVVVPHVQTVRVDRGDSLWRISRRIYGQGVRYTIIYDANQTQIRNPDRIYPGQLFVLPGGDPPAGNR